MGKRMEAIIPGYDYRVKKNRLNSDRAVRDRLVRELQKSYRTMKEVSDLAYRDGKRDVVDHIGDLLDAAHLFANEIENASYGMSPLFKEDKVSDDAIDRMTAFDSGLIEQMAIIIQSSDLFYDHVLKGETADIILQARLVKREIDRLRNTFSDRADFLLKN